ncbi:MAG: Mth938-like domain-containing protein [Pseudomonadota bacterium]
MRMTEMNFPDARPVEGYGPGFFRIGGDVIEGALLAGPDGFAPWEGLGDLPPLLAMEGKVDVLFLGTGADMAHPPAALRAALEEIGIGVEAMASPTACRTYNVTLSEGRRVALAALPV